MFELINKYLQNSNVKDINLQPKLFESVGKTKAVIFKPNPQIPNDSTFGQITVVSEFPLNVTNCFPHIRFSNDFGCIKIQSIFKGTNFRTRLKNIYIFQKKRLFLEFTAMILLKHGSVKNLYFITIDCGNEKLNKNKYNIQNGMNITRTY